MPRRAADIEVEWAAVGLGGQAAHPVARRRQADMVDLGDVLQIRHVTAGAHEVATRAVVIARLAHLRVYRRRAAALAARLEATRVAIVFGATKHTHRTALRIRHTSAVAAGTRLEVPDAALILIAAAYAQ